MSFALHGVTFSYPGAPEPVLRNIGLEVPPESHLILIGPNGAGKSTLLRVMLGRLQPSEGEVRFRDRPLSSWTPGAFARQVGVVPQEEPAPFPMTVRDYVGLGRYPHLGRWRPFRGDDRSAVERALGRCEITELAERALDALSGGERQRVRIARALAQQPNVLVLDEPTIHLDIRHEMEIFELIQSLVEEGLTVVTVTHNLSMAGRYAERIVLLDDGRVAAAGPVPEVLEPEVLQAVYRWPLSVDWPDDGTGPVVRPLGAVEVPRG